MCHDEQRDSRQGLSTSVIPSGDGFVASYRELGIHVGRRRPASRSASRWATAARASSHIDSTRRDGNSSAARIRKCARWPLLPGERTAIAEHLPFFRHKGGMCHGAAWTGGVKQGSISVSARARAARAPRAIDRQTRPGARASNVESIPPRVDHEGASGPTGCSSSSGWLSAAPRDTVHTPALGHPSASEKVFQ